MDKNLLFIHIPKCGGTSVKKALNIKTGHQTLQSYKDTLNPEEFDNSFTFSFVRNPFDRIASWHRFLLLHKNTNLDFETWFYKVFVEKDSKHRYRDEYFEPCYNWLTIDENLSIDFVGTLENVNQDFTKLTDILQVKANLNIHNATNGERKFSKEMKSIVYDLFKKDFETWYPQLLANK